MALLISLLGAPSVEDDGRPVAPPRGRKAWGLLAFLLRAERRVPRDQLASLLFGEADDPFAALRWNLSALRRILPGATIDGDPVRLDLPPGAVVDVNVLFAGSPLDAVRLHGVESELLEGVRFGSSPAFETWLLMERRHLQGVAEGALHEAALVLLAAGDPEGAAAVAARLVRVNPFEEGFQVLLVRSLATAGDGIAAARQAARCGELFRRELGIDPSPALAAAARTVTAASTASPRRGRAAARAQLEAGEAAIRAGSVDAGLECLRRAVADAHEFGDPGLESQALLALGSALVHAARGRDEEASSALHEVLAIADRLDSAAAPAAAARELGYVEFLRGRYAQATSWLNRAWAMADGDVAERARVSCVAGSVLSDTGRYAEAIERLSASRRLAEEAGDGRGAAYADSMLGRAYLLRGDLDDAARALDESLARVERERWTSFSPWPESLRGDVDLLRGDVERASERYEHAFALGCQIGDPCWEGVAGRGLGLVAASMGRTEEAVALLVDARRRCLRLPDGYRWVDAYTLEALTSLAVERSLPGALQWADDLALLAAGTGMRELLVRAHLHQAALGDATALVTARAMAPAIDSSALAALVEGSAH